MNAKLTTDVAGASPDYGSDTAPTLAAALDMFIRGAVLGRAIYAVVGAEGIACVPSPRDATRCTYLFWSHQGEAERWADAIVATPRVVALDLNGFIATTVPALQAAGATAGIDWSADPVEAEIEPTVLAAHLRDEIVRDFAVSAARTRMVWVLTDESGVAGAPGVDGGMLTPVWADRHIADAVWAAMDAPNAYVTRKALLDLTNGYLLSSTGLKARLAPGYIHAPNPVLMSPWALKGLLNSGDRHRPRLAAVG